MKSLIIKLLQYYAKKYGYLLLSYQDAASLGIEAASNTTLAMKLYLDRETAFKHLGISMGMLRILDHIYSHQS